MNVCIIDNFDSFTFNLYEEFAKHSCQINVWRNTFGKDAAIKAIKTLSYPKLVVFSPGPGHPAQVLLMKELLEALKYDTPILGVCLGMQAIIHNMGGEIGQVGKIAHGKAKAMTHDGSRMFKGLPNPFNVGRYHSLCGVKIPNELIVRGESEGIPMAITHKKHPIYGIQFHPESILTTYGSEVINNIITLACEYKNE